jgi:hypothetical protein
VGAALDAIVEVAVPRKMHDLVDTAIKAAEIADAITR